MQRIQTFSSLPFQLLRKTRLFNVHGGITPCLPLKFVNRAIDAGNEVPRRSKEATSPKQKIKKLTSISRILELSLKAKKMDQSSRVAALRRIAQIATRNEQEDARRKSKLLLKNEGQKSQYSTLLDDIGLKIAESSPQDLASTVWALARLGVRDPWLVEECERHLLRLDLTTFSDRHISMVAWGFSQISNTKRKPLFQALREDVIRRGVGGWKDRELSMLLMAFAHPDLKDEKIFGLFEQDILLGNLGSYDDVLLMQCLLSFAKAGYHSVELFNAIGNELVQRDLSRITPRALADTLWAYAKMDMNHRGIVSKMKGEICVRSLSRFSTSELGKITWAFTRLRMVTPSEKLFTNIENEILLRKPSQMGAVDMIQILWSFAQAQVKSNRLFHFFEDELTKRDLSRFPNGHLCQIAWSYTRKNLKTCQLVEKVWNEVNARGLTEFSEKERILLMNAK